MDFSGRRRPVKHISAYWKYDFAEAHISLGRVRIVYSHDVIEKTLSADDQTVSAGFRLRR
ncbi:hypothetical protein BURKHO8Y_20063 [Burkholderia sp. 8Y]|nr:hypothetical protein BURKHO8Y_20063 [Burkholderia sp. 8Y]